MAIFDIPTARLIEGTAEDLENKFNIGKPVFADFVKTGAGKNKAPSQKNWYYLRMASILYRVFKDGPVGTESLRTYYGSRQNRGLKPSKLRKASGKIIRLCLQELEKLEFIKKDRKGRVIAGKGHSYLEKKAKEISLVLKTEEKDSAENKTKYIEKMKQLEQKRAKERSELVYSDTSKFKKPVTDSEDKKSKKEKRKERKQDKKKKKK